MNYYFLVFGRDCVKSTKECLDSLISQTIRPAKISIVDDGSTDGTRHILLEYEKKYPDLIYIQETGNETRDYRRIPQLENKGLLPEYDLHCIVPLDIVLEPTYAEKIIKEFELDHNLVICSGNIKGLSGSTPRGAGRFVEQKRFFNNYYQEGYPTVCGFESEMLYRSRMNGFTIKIVNNVCFDHVDKLGHSHGFKEWGQTMRCMGYHPLFVIGRCVKDFVTGNNVGRVGAVRIFWKWLTFKPDGSKWYSLWDKELRNYIRKEQFERVKSFMSRRMQN
jgi:glycosyltransferase involved in cell wall biosynthesis